MPPFVSLQRLLAALALFGAGGFAGLILAPSPAITADADSAMAALEKRVATLEERLANMVDGDTFKAPFNIVDDSGRAIFSVTASGGGAVMQVMGEGGSAQLGKTEKGWGMVVTDAAGNAEAAINNPGGGMGLRVYEGGTEVVGIGNVSGQGGTVNVYSTAAKNAGASMFVNSDGSGVVQAADSGGSKGLRLDGQKMLMLIDSDEGSVDLGKTNSGWGLVLGDGGGQTMAELSEPEGKGMALRIYSQGANAAQIGVAPGTGGLLRLFASGDRRTIGLDSNADGTGMLQVAGTKGEDSGIKLDGQKEQVALDTTKGVSTLGATETGWGLLIGDAGGQPMADLSEPEGKGMALRIYNQGANAAQIGVAPGTGGLIRLFASGDRRTIGLDSNADGTGFLQIAGKKGEDSGIKLDGQKEQVTLYTTKGISTWGETTTGWGLFVGDPGGKPLADLTQPSGKGIALRIYEGAQQAAAIGFRPGQGGALMLYSNSVVALEASAASGGGKLQAYKAGVATAGIDGPNSIVTVYNASGQAVSMLTLAASGSGGKVQATDPGGVPVFKAGYTPDGPGTACVDHMGAKCLGIGLTGMEGFH